MTLPREQADPVDHAQFALNTWEEGAGGGDVDHTKQKEGNWREDDTVLMLPARTSNLPSMTLNLKLRVDNSSSEETEDLPSLSLPSLDNGGKFPLALDLDT